jgi:hypothetical protein
MAIISLTSGPPLKKYITFLLGLMIFYLVGCAGPNPNASVPDGSGDVAGFFLGLWHGLTLPMSFVGSIFIDGVSIYEVHNSGGWYNFGYLIGIALCFEAGGRIGHEQIADEDKDEDEVV